MNDTSGAAPAVEVHVAPVGLFQTNAWFLRRVDRDEVIVFDPGSDAEQLIDTIDSNGWKPVAILNTHGHIDHVGAVEPLRRRFRIPFYLHPADGYLLDSLAASAHRWGIPVPEQPQIDRPLAGDEVLELAGLVIEALATPGHTPGGVSFVVAGHVFAGDCLFQGSIGRTDFPGGDSATLLATLRDRFMQLPDATRVCPGHGPATTIERERGSNPFLRGFAG